MIGRDVQVALSNRRGSVVKTTTNQHGEFRGEVENSGDLEIFAGTGGNPSSSSSLKPWNRSSPAHSPAPGLCGGEGACGEGSRTMPQPLIPSVSGF